MGVLVPILALILVLTVVRRHINLRRNIRIAKTINVPFIIIPWHTGTVQWFILAPLVISILRFCLPSALTRTWIDFMHPYWTWYLGYEPFQQLGSDVIATVAPGGITFHCASPEVIAQVAAQRKEFMKPLELYEVMNTFGPNIVSTDGAFWRHQRKIMAPSFNEAHIAEIWKETIFQTKCMLASWAWQTQNLLPCQFVDVHDAVKSMSFNVVARGSFGNRFPYPGYEDKESVLNDSTLEGKHQMSFVDATLTVVHYQKWTFVLPRWILKAAPSKFLNQIWVGLHEMRTYFDEYINKRMSMSDYEKHNKDEKSILSTLIESTVESDLGNCNVKGLTRTLILGNVFNAVTAGHETTGSALISCLMNLAIHPDWQREMQEEIDQIFGGRDPATWVYNEEIEKLFKSTLDAVVCESLRLCSPNNVIPKRSAMESNSVLMMNGLEIFVPPDSRVYFLTASVHRNPNFWPHSSSTPLSEFHPERWFLSSELAEKYHGRTLDAHPTHLNYGNPNCRFFRPRKGAFIPWSIGPRDCIGRKFSHTEILVALACIFREYSIELVVRETESGWEETRERSRRMMKDGMKHYTTMQLTKGSIPLRIVRRGEETVF